MAMIQGSVSINPSNGAASGSGVAKEIFDALDSTIDYQGLSGAALYDARNPIANLCNAVALVIPHIQTHAVVSTSVETAVQLGTTANGVTSGNASATVTGSTKGSGTGTIS